MNSSNGLDADNSRYKLDNTGNAAVATDYYWNEDMSTCPISAKVQLLGKGGVAVYGIYTGHNEFWVAWAPLPKRRKPSGSDG